MSVQILDSGYVHLGYHADGADRLRDNAAGGAGAGDADPDDAGYRPYHKDEYAHDVGDGLGHDVERGEEREGDSEYCADKRTEYGDSDGLKQQVRHIGVAGAEHQCGVRVEHAVYNALCDLGAGSGQAGESDVMRRPADENNNDEDNQRVQEPFARAVCVHFRRGQLPVQRLLENFYFFLHHGSPFSSASCEDIR